MPNVIDLHGIKHKDAIELVEDTLLLASVKGDVDYKVITGNSKIMRENIIKVCTQWGFDYVVPSNNQGEINITWAKI